MRTLARLTIHTPDLVVEVRLRGDGVRFGLTEYRCELQDGHAVRGKDTACVTPFTERREAFHAFDLASTEALEHLEESL